jgi:hypothetical protein
MTSDKSQDVNNEAKSRAYRAMGKSGPGRNRAAIPSSGCHSCIFQGFGGGLVETGPFTAGEGVASGTTSNPGSMRASDPNLW